MVDSISTGVTHRPAQKPSENSAMKEKMKSMGVPESVIAQGKSAVMQWAKENGKGPYANKESGSSKSPFQDKFALAQQSSTLDSGQTVNLTA